MAAVYAEPEGTRVNFTLWETGRTRETMNVFQLCNHLQRRGARVTVTSLGRGFEHSWFPLDVKPVYVPIPESSTRKIFDGEGERECLASLLRSVRALASAIPPCDVNVAAHCLAAYAVLESGRGTPLHFLQDMPERSASDGHRGMLLSNSLHLPCKKIASSTRLRLLLEKLAGETVGLLHPGVDLSVFRPADNPAITGRGRGGTRKVACVQAEGKWSGLEHVLKAIAIPLRKLRGLELLLCGSDPPPVHVSSRAAFRRVFHPEEAADIYLSSDLVVTLCGEAYASVTPLEAMACGVPVMILGKGAEDYAVDGENALLFTEFTPSILGEAMLRLLSDEGLSRRLGGMAAETAVRYGWERVCVNFESMLHAPCGTCRGARL